MKYSIIALFLLVSLSWASAVEKPNSKREPRNALSQFLSKLSNERRASAIQEVEAKKQSGRDIAGVLTEYLLGHLLGPKAKATSAKKGRLLSDRIAKKQGGLPDYVIDQLPNEFFETGKIPESFDFPDEWRKYFTKDFLETLPGVLAKKQGGFPEGFVFPDHARKAKAQSFLSNLGNALLDVAVDTLLNEVFGSDAKANSLKIKTAKKQDFKELLSDAGGILLDTLRSEVCGSQPIANSRKESEAETQSFSSLGNALLGAAVDTVLNEILGSDAKVSSKEASILKGTLLDPRFGNHDSATKEDKASKESGAKIESNKVLLNELEEALAKLH